MNGVAQRFSKIRMPAEAPGSMTDAASTKSLSSSRPDTPLEDRQVERPVPVEVAQLDRLERAVLVPVDEHEVEDADDPPVDQVHQDREPLAGHPVSRGTPRSGN